MSFVPKLLSLGKFRSVLDSVGGVVVVLGLGLLVGVSLAMSS